MFDGMAFAKPEPAAFAYFKSLGFDGTYCEGTGPLMLMKCACLDYLFEVNTFKSREDACMRYFEAQCKIHEDKSTRIVEEITSATEATIRQNFREVSQVPRYSTLYPAISEDGLIAIWYALTPAGLARLAQAFTVAPYDRRAGWPDLTIANGAEVRFVEIKTTDRFHASQKQTIEEMLLPCGASVSAMQIRQPSPAKRGH
jgi:hypothetical protein